MGFVIQSKLRQHYEHGKPSSEWETIYAYAVVNFLSQVNFCFSFVFEY